MKTYIGIDWSERAHCVRAINEAGAQVLALTIPATTTGFSQLHRRLQQLNPDASDSYVAIETHHNSIVDFLQMAGYTIYIVSPTTVSSNRGRQGAAGAKDDDRDALLLADIVRTDRGRLLVWQPDGVLVRQLRTLLRGIDDLTGDIVRQHNRLRDNLLRYYPQAVSAFKPLHEPVPLRFLADYPRPMSLDLSEFRASWRQCGGRSTKRQAQMWTCLQEPSPILPPELVATCAERTQALAARLLTLTIEKRTNIAAAHALFARHQDAFIYASLPGAGKLLQPKLLAMMGDHRDRYPTAAMLAAIAGTAPVTIASGRSHYVKFRRACDYRLRTTMQQLAKASLRKSAYAAEYVYRLQARGHSYSHTLRCLANRWVRIIWTLWQRREAYDESFHLRQVHRRRQPLAA